MSNMINEQLGSLVASGGGKIHTGPFGSQLHASDYVVNGIPCIMPANMKENRVDLTNIAFISSTDAQRLSKYIVKEGDIVYSRRGDVTQKALIEEKETGYFCGTGCLLLRPGEKLDSKYLTYYLSTQTIKRWLISQAVGATMPNLNTGILSSVPFHGPERVIQQKIAAVLSALDAKIELNNRINAELEAMAKTLYDYWFVQFDFPDENGKPYQSSGGKMVYNETLKREIPDGWGVKKLKDFAVMGSGGTPLKSKKEFYENGNIPWINSGEVNEPFIVSARKFITEEGLKKSSAKMFKKGTILMAMYGATAGKVSFMDMDACTNQAICAINPNDDVYRVYVKLGLEDLYKYLVNLSSGSARDNLSQDKIKELNFVIPENILLKQFDGVAQSLMSKVLINLKENQQLAEIRDWLLPMLMNGQVTVR